MQASPATAPPETGEMTRAEDEIADLVEMGTRELKAKWRRHYRTEPPARLSRDLSIRHRLQDPGTRA